MTTPTRSRPPVDPRMRDRRIEVKRREGKRRLRILATLLSVVVIVAVFGLATRSPLLDVDQVLITGATNTPSRTVLVASGLDHHRQMIDAHTARMARAIDRLPWVDRVVVERQWPATIRITIKERVPVASVAATGGGWAMVDVHGRVLAHRPAPVADLTQVAPGGPTAGADGTPLPRQLLDAVKVAGAIPEALRARAPVVAVGPEGLELRLLPSGVARLGNADGLTAKLDSVLTVLDHANIDRLAVLDVRVPAAPVLTRR